jgi:hypothetical protein
VKSAFLALLVSFTTVLVKAQERDTTWRPPPSRNWVRDEVTLLAGYAQGYYGAVELGLGRSIYGMVHHPIGINYHMAVEVRPDRSTLIGWKLGGYITFGAAMGVQVIRYQEGTTGCTVLRPEFGCGIWKAKVAYAYNINLSPHRIRGISRHMVALSYAFRLKRLPTPVRTVQ